MTSPYYIYTMIRGLLFTLLMSSAMTIMAQKIEFKADINEISPMSYPARAGLSGFSFELRNDSAFVYLPYMGEVHNPSYSNDGLNFAEPCSDMSVKPTKKTDGKIIEFGLRHDAVKYKFNVTLWDNNRLDIFMQPSNAQGCNYSGEWESIQSKPKKGN